MEALVAVSVLTISLYILYGLYKPRIDIVVQPRRKVVLLWYNLYENGYPTGRRTYKKLLTL